MFERLVWREDRVLLDDRVFRLEPFRSDGWELGDRCFRFYKTKPLVDEYERFWSRQRDFKARNVFELGIRDGGCVAFWCELLRPERHVAVDIVERGDSEHFREYLASRKLEGVVTTYWGVDQSDGQRLTETVRREFSGPLDLVIDDASHEYVATKRSFEALFPLLRPGGLYVIEDWARGLRPEFRAAGYPLAPKVSLGPLVVELIEAVGARGGGAPGWIAKVDVYSGFVVAERGEACSTAVEFRLADLVARAGVARENRITGEVDRVIEGNDRLTRALGAVVADRERLRATHEATVERLRAERDRELAQLSAELQTLRETLGWRFLTLYRRVAASGPVSALHRAVTTPLRVLARAGRRDAPRGQPPAAPVARWSVAEHWTPLQFDDVADPDVSIVIPVHGNHLHTFTCLCSLLDARARPSYEVVVVDDGSSRETRAMLEAMQGIRVVRHEQNRGFVDACNSGAAAARGRYLVFLNNDTIVSPGWLDALLETYRLVDGAGAVGAKLVYPNGRLQEAGGIVWRDASAWNFGRDDDPDRPDYSYLREVDFCSAACLLTARELFVKLGGFDPRYAPAYYEDVDLCFRIREAGFKVLYQPAVTVVHWEGATAGNDLTAGVKRFQAINRPRFRARWADVLRSHCEPGQDVFHQRERHVRRRAFVVDANILTPDRDAGSDRMWRIIELLLSLSYKVTFAASHLGRLEPYVSRLQRRGVEVLYRPFVPSIERHLEEVGRDYDVVLLSRPDVGEAYLDVARVLCPHALLIYDTVDLYFIREQREAEVKDDWGLRGAAARRKRQEIGLMARADATLVVTARERDVVLKELPDACVEVVSMIHDAYGSASPFDQRRDLLFVGGFAHRPNSDAAEHLVRDVFPLIRENLPGVKLFLVGSHPPPEVYALQADDVVVTGYVEDIGEYFGRCRVFVAPIRFGAGVRGKITTSMSYGLPVAATTLAVEGMELVTERDVLIGDAPGDLAEAVVRLYTHEELWNRLSDNALQRLQRDYSPAVARRTLERLLGSRSRPRP